jgi:hypothetical protein
MMVWTTPAHGIKCAKRCSLKNETPEGGVHMQISTIGVDLAKNVFQVHGVDSNGKVVVTRQLRRKQVLEFSANLPCVSLAWKPAARSTIGRGRSRSLDTQ